MLTHQFQKFFVPKNKLLLHRYAHWHEQSITKTITAVIQPLQEHV